MVEFQGSTSLLVGVFYFDYVSVCVCVGSNKGIHIESQ